MNLKPAARTVTAAVAVLTLGGLSAGAATPSPSTIRQRTPSTVGQQLTTTSPPTVAAPLASPRRGRGWATADSGATSLGSQGLLSDLTSIPKATLTPAERDGLVFMREEEKLALDVYTALYAKWGLKQFDSIARAEATHTSAVKALLDRYGIKDPSAGTKPGVFINPDLQALYTKLIKQGSVSATEALKVGALIEEVDIADLQKRSTTTADIDLVYANLEKGSRNHLRAFVSGLYFQGVTYSPTVLSKAAFAAIVNAPIERGQAN
jgi:hypothetical protein